MSEAIRALEAAQRKRYSDRLAKFGDDPRTLGWDTRENQRLRFEAALALVDPKGKSVLDVGCGFADLLSLLKETGRAPKSYRGVDINPDLLAVAAKKHPGASFEARNLFDAPFPAPVADVGFMSGVLNLKLSFPTNAEFSRTMIRHAFAACREALAVDMLSDWRDPAYPAEDFVHYYDPLEMLSFARELTPHVALRADGPSIPQRELVLVLRREPAR